MATKTLKKAAPKKAVKKVAPKAKAKKVPKVTVTKKAKTVLIGGEYFTATYKGQKIRGQGRYISGGNFGLFNKGIGNKVVCVGRNNSGNFSHYITIQAPIRRKGNRYLTAAQIDDTPILAAAGVTDYKACKDSRQVKLIQTDSNPEVQGYGITFHKGKALDGADDVFSFGCGAVKLSRAQVTAYLNRRTIEADPQYAQVKNAIERHLNNHMQVSVASIEAVLNLK